MVLFSVIVSVFFFSNVLYFSLITTIANKHQASRKRLITDVLAIHMVRSPKNSTLITYHPPRGTDAKTLHDRVYYAGASVYWNRLYTQAADPTFVLLAALWYALYAWDQAFEILYEHICFLVRRPSKLVAA